MKSLLFSVVVAIIVVIFAALSGNSLPLPYRKYVPMVAGNALLPGQPVREYAFEGQGTCLALFGDSRLAFGIEAKHLLKSNTTCEAGNYGYPGLGLSSGVDYSNDLITANRRIDFAVVVFNHIFALTSSDPSPSPSWDVIHEETVTAAFMQLRLARWIYLGENRLYNFVRRKLLMSIVDDGWSWDSDLGRWHNEGLETRKLQAFDIRKESAAIAFDYFDRQNVLSPDAIAEQFRQFKDRAGTLVIVLPPSDEQLYEAADQVNPGVIPKIIAAVKAAASKVGADVIDCSHGSDCGVEKTGFGDPVHLNGEGARSFTQWLGPKLADLIAERKASAPESQRPGG